MLLMHSSSFFVRLQENTRNKGLKKRHTLLCMHSAGSAAAAANKTGGRSIRLSQPPNATTQRTTHQQEP